MRRKAIVDSARALFAENGYDATTIESVAEHAFVSTPTVYNYFSTKAGLLLGIISEGDKTVVAALKKSVAKSPASASAEKAISDLLILMVRVSLDTLDRSTWQKAYAMTVLAARNDIGGGYNDLNNVLYDTLEELLVRLVLQGKLPSETDVKYLRVLFGRLNHALFGEVISDGGLTLNQYQQIIRRYVKTIVGNAN